MQTEVEVSDHLRRLSQLKAIRSELGVPGEGYPQNVVNAYDIASAAISEIEDILKAPASGPSFH